MSENLSERIRFCADKFRWLERIKRMTGEQYMDESLQWLADGVAGLEGSLAEERRRVGELEAKLEEFSIRPEADEIGAVERVKALENEVKRLQNESKRNRATIQQLDVERSQVLKERDKWKERAISAGWWEVR